MQPFANIDASNAQKTLNKGNKNIDNTKNNIDMKHMIYAAIVAAAMTPATIFASTPVQISGKGISVKTDNTTIDISVDSTATGAKATIVIDGDTVASADVKNNMIDKLNDTLLASSNYSYTDNYDEDSANDDYYYLRKLELNHNLRTQLTTTIIIGIIFGAIVLTVIAILIVYYMNRRRRLQVIEKAIENNYTLPDNFYSTKTTKMQYTTEAPTGNDNQPTNIPQYAPDRDLRRGLTFAIVGFGLILFFITLGVDFLAALSVIPFMYGIAKILIPYLHKLYGTQVPPMPSKQPTQQNQAEQPQQPNNDNPTVTPPTFSHNNTEIQDEK